MNSIPNAFDRSSQHFTSHMHSPVGTSLDAPLIVAGNGVVYLASPLISSYGSHGYWVYKSFIRAAMRSALGDQLLERHGPAWIEPTVHRQLADDGSTRYLINLTAYQVRRSVAAVPRVDDHALTAGIRLTLRPGPSFQPRQATLEPGGRLLELRRSGAALQIELPPIAIHTVVVVHGEGD